MTGPAELQAAGLYDPTAPDAEERLALLRWLCEQGATVEEMVEAAAGSRLEGLAAELILGTGPMNAVELAGRVGTDPARVIEMWRLMGVPVTPEERRFDESDVELVRLCCAIDGGGIIDQELLTVMGSGLARVAEAGVAAFVQGVEWGFDEAKLPALDRAMITRDKAAAGVEAGRLFGTALRHHLWEAVQRQRRGMAGVSVREHMRLAVGFVDLVGFTPLSRQLDPRDLLATVSAFERRAFDCVTRHGGRVVKHVGDEVMFVTVDAPDACRIAGSLLAEFLNESGIRPRGGLAYGDVVFGHGDYYGPVVNLASRLADEAIPYEVLVDDGLARAADGFAFEPAGRRLLKGFEEPIDVRSLWMGEHKPT